MKTLLRDDPSLTIPGGFMTWKVKGNKTYCTLFYGGIFYYGESCCSPKDQFDQVYGMKIALLNANPFFRKSTKSYLLTLFGDVYGWDECKPSVEDFAVKKAVDCVCTQLDDIFNSSWVDVPVPNSFI